MKSYRTFMSSSESLFLIVARGATVAGGVLALRLLSQKMPASHFDAYVIGRQVMTWLVAVGFMGMATALPRAIVARSRGVGPRTILFCSAGLVAAALLIPLTIIVLAPRTFSRLLFGAPDWASLAKPFSILIVATAVFSLLQLYCRGLYWFKSVVLVGLLCVGVVPVLLVSVMHRPVLVQDFLFLYGVVLLILCSVGFGVLLLQKNRQGSETFALARVLGVARDLLNFGVPKLLSGIVQMCCIGLTPVALIWAGATMRRAAAAALGLAVGVMVSRLALTATGLVTFNQIVAAKEGKSDSLPEIVRNLLRVSVGLGFVLCLFGGIGADVIVSTFIGRAYEGYRGLLNLGAAVGFLFFSTYMLEIPLDAISPPWSKAKASVILFFAGCAVIVAGVKLSFLGPVGVISVIGLSLLALAVFLFFSLKRRMCLRGVLDARLGLYIALALLSCGAFVMVRLLTSNRWLQVSALGAAATIVLVLFYRAGFLSVLLGGGDRASHGKREAEFGGRPT